MTHVIRASGDKPWTFLTNHARALINIAHNPSTRLRDIADAIGITARAAQTIVNDLEESGYITRTRVGRRNHYSVDPTRPFRHPADAGHRIEGLLALFADHDHDRAATGPAPRNRRRRGDERPAVADDHPQRAGGTVQEQNEIS